MPVEVRDAVPDRVLAAAPTSDGAWLVGTRHALHVVGGGRAETVSLRWERVLRADWDDESSTLRIEEVTDYGEPVAAESYVLHEAGLLLQLVRERVTASIALQRRVELGRRRGLTVMGRRAPGGDEVVWAFQLDPGVDPDDPAVRAAADTALREAQESLGWL